MPANSVLSTWKAIFDVSLLLASTMTREMLITQFLSSKPDILIFTYCRHYNCIAHLQFAFNACWNSNVTLFWES